MIAALGLAGCDMDDRGNVIIQYKNQVIAVPPSMFKCPVLKKYPEVKTLKDSQVAELILELQRNNVTCAASLETIRKYLERAKARVEQ